MADIKQESLPAGVDKMAESPCKEAEILRDNKKGQEGATEIPKPTEGETKAAEEEQPAALPKLPKLSARDFVTYNSMADHME